MKAKDAQLESGHRMVVYVEREDGTYGPMETSGYLTTNYLDDLLDKQSKWKRESLEKLLAGKVSFVGFYFEVLGMAEADLAVRAGVSARALRRHMTPEGFREVTVAQLEKYAEIFDVPIANLFQILRSGEGGARLVQRSIFEPVLVETSIQTGEAAGER
jgi:hypothetical protein